MSKQPDKVFALYYRAARTNDNDTTLHLDNQMHQLLQYARQHGIDNFALYVDMGYPGRPLTARLSRKCCPPSTAAICRR